MKAKKFWRAAISFFTLVPAIIIFLSPTFVEANYTVGIVGISNRVHNLNLGDYTDLTNLENPLAYAQDAFKIRMTTGLPRMGLTGIDKTEQADSARLNEVIFQLELGDPGKAVKLFDKTPDYLIYGYITNFTVTHRESLATSNLAVRIDLSVRIMEVATGEIVCVATGKGESASHGDAYRKAFKMGGEEISEACWDEALNKAFDQILKSIQKQV